MRVGDHGEMAEDDFLERGFRLTEEGTPRHSDLARGSGSLTGYSPPASPRAAADVALDMAGAASEASDLTTPLISGNQPAATFSSRGGNRRSGRRRASGESGAGAHDSDGGSPAPRHSHVESPLAAADHEGITVEPLAPLADLLVEATNTRVRQGYLCGDWLAERLPAYSSISDLIANSSRPAITPVDARASLTHTQLKDLIYRVDDELKTWGVTQAGSRVGVAVPNGPELMSVLLSVIDRHTCVPVNPATTPQEMHEELRATGVVALVYQGGSEMAVTMRKLCEKLKIVPLAITPDPNVGGLFSISSDVDGASAGRAGPGTYAPPDSDKNRTALVLHTSGSTGKKKIVPISLHQLVLGATAIGASSGLGSDDVCLNFMPLFHVGGICRNLLAPIFAGGSTVAMPFFDADDFWQTAVQKQCTWYYGAPTMHLLVVNSAKAMPTDQIPDTKIRFIANAAGPLLPSVAIELRKVFNGAAVLTSYGMTECMPIACPPPGYALERAGSSGQAICPEIAIVDDSGERVANGRVAHIVVKGSIVTRGYENDPEATKASFHPGGWFKTGDMGWMDADGYLYVTGRSKEVINRGGEIISPAEVEEALQSHPGVADVVAISIPHATLQETVAVVVVPTRGIQEPGLRQLCQHASDRLPPAKWPQCLVLVESIPKLATGKVSRSAIAKSLDIQEIRDGMWELDVTFEASLEVNAGRGSSGVAGHRAIATRDEATQRVAEALSKASGVEDTAACIDTTGSNALIGAVTPADADTEKVMSFACRCLPGFLEPKDVIAVDEIPRAADGKCDAQALLALWKGQKAAGVNSATFTATQRAVAEAWANTLNCDARTVGLDDDFFQVGGSSIVAGQLAADIRRKLSSNLTGADIFRYRTVKEIAAKVEKEGGGTKDGNKTEGGLPPSMANKPLGPMEWTRSYSSTSFFALLFQSLPLLVFAPMQKILRWTIFLNMWSFCIHGLHPAVNFVHHISNYTPISVLVRAAGVDPENEHFHHLRLVAFFVALVFTGLISFVLFPVMTAMLKWTVLGRLKPGLHPLWGSVYIRWWLSNKAVEVSGFGIFGMSDGLFRIYLRMMGARVGRGAKIGRLVRIADFDMLEIHANAAVDDYAHLRAAEVRRGALRVAPVYLGPGSTVCTRAIVGPGGVVPQGATLGPYMSWRELDVTNPKTMAQMEEHRKIARMRQPQPGFGSQMLAWPIVFVCEVVAWIPWIFVFVVLIRSQGLYLSIPGEGGLHVDGTPGSPITFLHNPAGYIKNWLGQFTGANAVGANEISPAMFAFDRSTEAFVTDPHVDHDHVVEHSLPTAQKENELLAERLAPKVAATRSLLGWDNFDTRKRHYANFITERGAHRARYASLGDFPKQHSGPASKLSEKTREQLEHWYATVDPVGSLGKASDKDLGRSDKDGSKGDSKGDSKEGSKESSPSPSPRSHKNDSGASFETAPDGPEPVVDDKPEIFYDAPDGEEVPDEEGGMTMPRGTVVHSFYFGDPLFAALDGMTWKDCITWFMDPFRLGVIFAARVGHNIFGPLLQLIWIVLVKWIVVGKFKPGPLPRTYLAREWELTRRWLMNKLLPKGDFRGALAVLGKHYEYTSIVYRMLGAKIGKRVFWPGSGVLVADGMYDLVDIGDDVVWGSRSMVFPADCTSSLPVSICRGANVSDRCVIYAGVTLMDDACLGSGAVAPRKMKYDYGSIHVGSRNGACVQLDPGSKPDDSVLREPKPFGRAVYQRKATYFLPHWQVMPFVFSFFIALRTAYSVMPIWVSWYLVAIITWDLGNNFWTEMPEWRYLLLLIFVYLWVNMIHVVVRFIIDTGLKWLIIGRREPGLYPWDRSSYCIRWKIFESLCSDTLHSLRLIGGSAFLPFFYNIMGSRIGRRVCLYPTGADPPMVEPDLVVIEDGACVNFTHIICHTNTLGSFALNHIVIKSGATLSTESRIMGGVVIGEDAVLLEHTMAMVGDVVEPGDIWQGWPVQAIAKADEVAKSANDSTEKAEKVHEGKVLPLGLKEMPKPHKSYGSHR